MTGLVLSIWTVRVLGASWFPVLSVAKYVMVVLPSVVMATTALLPATTFPPVEAPLSVKLRFFTPEPPALSVVVSVMVTLALFHPLALALGEGEAVVVGGMVSAATCVVVSGVEGMSSTLPTWSCATL
jgi:hypothetical protein